jgi:hypothetical protein
MARCPFATFRDGAADAGAFTSGPFKIVLHTTEGDTLEGAIGALETHHSQSHFVVGRSQDGSYKIVQLIDTARASKSLRNDAGGVQTNKDSAIQIEMVGRAGKPKDQQMLALCRQLLRWIEATHFVPRLWPNGFCVPAVNGNDAGHHNRDAHTWDTQGGYYGHEHVPENQHWDPALTKEETEFLMADEAVAIVPEPTAASALPQFKVSGVTPDTLNLRATPNGPKVGEIAEGAVVDKLAASGKWLQVRTPAGDKGWAFAKYLTAA